MICSLSSPPHTYSSTNIQLLILRVVSCICFPSKCSKLWLQPQTMHSHEVQQYLAKPRKQWCSKVSMNNPEGLSDKNSFSAESGRPIRGEREPVRQLLGDWLSRARGHLASHGQSGHRYGGRRRWRRVLVQEKHRGGCLFVLSGLHRIKSKRIALSCCSFHPRPLYLSGESCRCIFARALSFRRPFGRERQAREILCSSPLLTATVITSVKHTPAED